MGSTLVTYWRRRALGTCATCSNPDPVKPPHVRCLKCRRKDADMARKRYQAKQAQKAESKGAIREGITER